MSTELYTQIHIAGDPWNGLRPPTLTSLSGFHKYAKSLQSDRDWEQTHTLMKPPGSFWTSSQTEEGLSDWVFCSSFNDKLPSNPQVIVFSVIGQPKILKLKTYEDVLEAMQEVGIPTRKLTSSPEKFMFDSLAVQFWPLAIKKWDAVHVPRDWEYPVLGLWEIESTAWFRPQAHLALAEPLRPLYQDPQYIVARKIDKGCAENR